jgi:hypothetical protein
MTRTEIITRLCEMAAELADLEQQAQDPDVKFGVSSIEEEMQKTLREIKTNTSTTAQPATGERRAA